ncbi:hypothetical protein PHLGIDRAFT_128108 [Phlebiopsis gigantea 11061_1 CR5-6]|uniref:Glucose-methanol-choline oxidoreductase N-terminal domain-containing protein n=1 Tax=Phlebiopsis gigantea (strain 11061_1 CR5-6) TaxID=745531 RepID=A0A0C3NNK0_PHLG1|nr:hypothetical protein PHLGIDRAFT_128108 [Phlebiopsis gigantea 11061_1 CR5-6]
MAPFAPAVVLSVALGTSLATGVVTTTPPPANTSFDYVVIGGGTTGLTVASRLSVNPAIRVLTIEAGLDNRTDPGVQSVFSFASAIGGPLDWAWKTEDGVTLDGGKTLGGSSSINGAAWTRGQDLQFDAWNQLLEPSEKSVGWGWDGPDGLFAFMKKSETFHPPDALQRSPTQGINATYDPSAHGLVGPVQASFPLHQFMAASDAGIGIKQTAFIETCGTFIGLEHGIDVNGGNPTGVWVNPLSIDPARNDNRSSSAEAYLTPVENSRPNWTVLVGHMATRILFTPSNSSGNAIQRAYAIEFSPTSSDGTDSGTRFTVQVNKEAILAAGTIQTPSLLQLSGVGPSEVLDSLDIQPVVPLEGVGRNLQEQPAIPVEVNTTVFDVNGTRLQDAMAFPNVFQLFTAGTLTNSSANVSQVISANLDSWAESEAQRGGGISKEALKSLFTVQAQTILSGKAPISEFWFFDPSFILGPDSAPATAVNTWNLLPFSRGNVSINSTNPFEKPRVRVGYFDVDFDMQVSIATLRAARRLFRSAPFSSIYTGELAPAAAVPDPTGDGGSDADWRAWILSVFSSNSHPIGTAAMMRRDIGGVVDARLKVYGTANVRVVDASIMPMQVSAHLSAPLYGIAEKAAALIAEDA